ncbi:MAG: carboxypeptidase-like regulatory domain-containing protein [Paludibacteraceae bacterium]|nr:carboxypeptidase-like regulatory domain-containing protein [Paludibacteraceae bacterium]
MKRTLFLTFLCGALACFTSCEPIVYDTFGTLSGTVVEMATGDVIAGAVVTLAPSGKNTYTGVDGFFEFQDLEAQQYTLTVQATGYSTNRKTVTVVAGATEKVNITLEKR